MKRKQLLSAIISVKPGVASKDIIESMTYLYFSGEAVISYNDVISIQYPLVTDFKTFVKADDFFKVISKIKSEEVKFKLEDTSLKMRADKMMSTFATIFDEEIIKRIATVSESRKGVKPRKLPTDFVESVRLCMQVASKNESDQLLTCLSINGKDIVSTDNIRIAHAEMKSDMEEMLIKASELKALIAINPIAYAATKTWIHFINAEECVFSIRRTKGAYPDMLKFTEFDGIEVTLPQEILDGVDIASVFTDDANDSISITIKNKTCRVFKESQAGKIDFRSAIDYTGQDVTFNIHPDLLKEMMTHSTNLVIAASRARLETDGFTLVTSLFTE